MLLNLFLLLLSICLLFKWDLSQEPRKVEVKLFFFFTFLQIQQKPREAEYAVIIISWRQDKYGCVARPYSLSALCLKKVTYFSKPPFSISFVLTEFEI